MRVDLDAKSRAEKVIQSTKHESSAAISPDGTKIAYLSNRNGTEDLWVRNLETGGDNLLSSGGSRTLYSRNPMEWSPNGKFILRPSPRLIDVATGRTERLADQGSRPCWSRDGRWIYYLSYQGGQNGLWRMNADGSDPKRLMDLAANPTIRASLDPAREGLYLSTGDTLDWLPFDAESRPAGPVETIAPIGGRDSFSVVKRGVYFLDDAGWVQFYDSRTGQIEPVYEITDPVYRGEINVSRDGRWLLYTRATRSGSDLMLLESLK